MKANRTLFPEKGLESSSLMSELAGIKSGDADWREGRMFGYVYYPGEEIAKVAEESHRMFSTENSLSPSLFNSLKKFENETVQMMSDLLHGPVGAAGSLTSGGTESILMALKSARDYSRARHPGKKQPEVVAPVSVHPAFDKAAHYLGIRLVHTPVRPDKRADAAAIEDAVTPDTIMIAASAPCFPHGDRSG